MRSCSTGLLALVGDVGPVRGVRFALTYGRRALRPDRGAQEAAPPSEENRPKLDSPAPPPLISGRGASSPKISAWGDSSSQAGPPAWRTCYLHESMKGKWGEVKHAPWVDGMLENVFRHKRPPTKIVKQQNSGLKPFMP